MCGGLGSAIIVGGLGSNTSHAPTLPEMVVFPLAKLLALAVKQVSKPVANQIKLTAKNSPFLRRYVCAPPAQGKPLQYQNKRICYLCGMFLLACFLEWFVVVVNSSLLLTSLYVCFLLLALHHLEVFVKYRLMGGQGKVEYARLKEERAVEVGSDMIGEMVVYGIAAGVIFYEVWNSRKLAEEKERMSNEEMASVKDLIVQQECELILLKSRVEKLEKHQRIGDKDRKTLKAKNSP